MSVTCKLRYDERTLEAPTTAQDRIRLVRQFRQPKHLRSRFVHLRHVRRVRDDDVERLLALERRVQVAFADVHAVTDPAGGGVRAGKLDGMLAA